MSYDRYSEFRVDGEVKLVPYVRIPETSNEFYEVYRKNKSRLDRISYDYYKDPNYGWLILMANPDVGGAEYQIPDNTELRIPYPLEEALEGYTHEIENYYKYYSSE